MELIAPPPAQLHERLARRAAWLCNRVPAYPLRHWRLDRLRASYERGRSNPVRDLPDEEADPKIVEAGRQLREALLAANAGKHADAGFRVLMLRPSSITAEIWFGDLQRCMEFAGIGCRVLSPGSSTAEINSAFEAFTPNVFVAVETLEALQTIDLHFVRRYKRDQGCLRLFVPVWHSKAPRTEVFGGRSTPEQDLWRRHLRSNGYGADAHFTHFQQRFHELFSRDANGPVVECVTIAQACNPFTDYPIATIKRHAYCAATTVTDERVAVSYRFLRSILGRYRGYWAGQRWGFGEGAVSPADMARHYAQARIALGPLAGFVQKFSAEVTHRVYAAAACGTFQLTTTTPIAGRYFRPEELVQASSPAEFVRLFDYYVDRPAERNAIALAALHRVYGEHTCFHRVDTLVSHWERWRRQGLF
jgi:hypothetical protein